MKQNIVKETANNLNMTYKELGDEIGYGESAVKKAASTGEISSAMRKAIELYLEVIAAREERQKQDSIRDALREWLK